MNKRLVRGQEILTDKEIEKRRRRLLTSQERTDKLFEKGYWQIKNIESACKRSKRTIQQWDRMLGNLVNDYGEGRKTRRPLSDYHYWCLQRLSKFQNTDKPYKSEDELVSFIERNDFSLQKYKESKGK